MSVPEAFISLVGQWKGRNRLHADWLADPIIESESLASVVAKMRDQFLQIDYTWQYEGNVQEGTLLFGSENGADAAQAVWTDSWHLSNNLMLCDGNIANGNLLNVKGYYKVTDHPDWGWRTEVTADASRFKYVMFNVSPAGDEEVAVEMDFERSG